MRIKLNKHDLRISLLLITNYILLIANYKYVISNVYGYIGFESNFYTMAKVAIISLMTCILIGLSVFFKSDFYKIIYTMSMILFYFGQSVFYLFNQSNYILVIYMSIPLLMIFIIDKLDSNKIFKRKKFDLKNKKNQLRLTIIIVIMIIPFLKYINTLDIKNLLFINVYESRLQLREYSNALLGYLFSPLSRVLLPFLFISGVKSKNKKTIMISTIGILLVYLLNGAVKSVFFGFLSIIFFMKGSYKQKEKRFLRAILLGNIVGLLGYFKFEMVIINDYMRRIFFVPARLFQIYFDVFKENYTLFLHSKLSKLLGVNIIEGSLSLSIGEEIIGKQGANANVGIFTEGFFSFGTVGVIIASIIFCLIIITIKKLKYDNTSFGIIFSYLYIINTSFIETLMVTHGLLFFIIFSYFFMPVEEECISL